MAVRDVSPVTKTIRTLQGLRIGEILMGQRLSRRELPEERVHPVALVVPAIGLTTRSQSGPKVRGPWSWCAVRHGVALGTSVPDFATAESLMPRGYKSFTGPSDFEPVIRAAQDWVSAARSWRDKLVP
jgi:hypothetical protein